jgi:hypothetical protein
VTFGDDARPRVEDIAAFRDPGDRLIKLHVADEFVAAADRPAVAGCRAGLARVCASLTWPIGSEAPEFSRHK